MAKCIITGCGLDIGDGSYFWGDLHEQGDQWIFNATLFQGEAEDIGQERILGQRCLHTGPDADCFLRRGVFIIPKSQSELNQAAQAYLQKAPQ